jgi:hypothetical protein
LKSQLADCQCVFLRLGGGKEIHKNVFDFDRNAQDAAPVSPIGLKNYQPE